MRKTPPVAFRNDVGTGEGSSGLQFDRLQSTGDAVIVSDTLPVISVLLTGASLGSAVIEGESTTFEATFDNEGPSHQHRIL